MFDNCKFVTSLNQKETLPLFKINITVRVGYLYFYAMHINQTVHTFSNVANNSN